MGGGAGGRPRRAQPRPRLQEATGNSGETVTAQVDLRPVRVSFALGDFDAFLPASPANYARNLRLQALGYLYTPLGERPASGDPDVPEGPGAWRHFQSVEGSDLAAKLANRVVTSPIGSADVSGLPRPGEHGRIRVPGAYCVRPSDTLTALYGEEPVANPSWRARLEAEVLRHNHYLRAVPIVVRVEVQNGSDWARAPAGRTVHVELVAPDPEPRPPDERTIRSTPWANTYRYSESRTTLRRTIPPQSARSPRQYIDAVRARWATSPGNPRANNAPDALGGRISLPWAFVPPPPPPSPDPNAAPAPPPRPFWRAPLPLTIARAGAAPNTIDVDTDANGEALVILMVSTIGGDAYKLRASLTAPPGAAAYQPAETGTLVVWRTARIARYLQWNYPSAASQSAESTSCGGDLVSFEMARITNELAKAHIEVVAPTSPQPLQAAEWRDAASFARTNLLANLALIGFDRTASGSLFPNWDDALLGRLLPTDDNPHAGLVRFAPYSQCKTELLAAMSPDHVSRLHRAAQETARPPANAPQVESGLRDAWVFLVLRNMLDAMQFGMVSFLLRDAPGGLLLLQAPAPSSLESTSRRAPLEEPARTQWRPQRDDLPLDNPFFHSGFGTPYRGAIVSFGRNEYAGRPGQPNLPRIAQTPTMNALHELGHVLYLRHQYTSQTGVSSQSALLDENDNHDLCLMGYTIPEDATTNIDFCGRCLLHLAGWNTGALPPNGNSNPTALPPVAAAAAVRQPNAPAERQADRPWTRDI